MKKKIKPIRNVSNQSQKENHPENKQPEPIVSQNQQPDQTEQSAPPPKTISNILGEITWLMTRSMNHRYFFISDLEWMILQPVSLGQFRMFQGEKFPVGAAFWAFVNEEIEERLRKGITKMTPADWKSGESLWLIDLIAPFGNVEKMLADLTENVFPDRPFKYLQRNEEGNMIVMESKIVSEIAKSDKNG